MNVLRGEGESAQLSCELAAKQDPELCTLVAQADRQGLENTQVRNEHKTTTLKTARTEGKGDVLMEGDVPLAVRVNGIPIWTIRLRRNVADGTPEVVDRVLGPFAIDDRFAIEVRALAGAPGLAATACERHWRSVNTNRLFNLLLLNQLH